MTIATLGQGIGAIALYAVIGLVLMVAGFYVIDWTTPGKLSQLVRSGHPNAAVVTAAGLFSIAFIVVVAIYNSPSRLTDGVLTALVFGVVGIIVQIIAIRVFEFVMRIDMGALFEGETFSPVSIVVASAHLALGLVVAAAIS